MIEISGLTTLWYTCGCLMPLCILMPVQVIAQEAGLPGVDSQQALTTPASPQGAYILTPPPAATPRINGASVFGVRPGSPLLYRIPVTGERPIRFAAKDLPVGLALDEMTGIITGALAERGAYRVTLTATNAKGKSERVWTVKVGDTIALTPPMGWNSWNCWARSVDDGKLRAAAAAMIASGLADHGWTYINIDDAWQGKRTPPTYSLQANDKFPDMKGLCDYIHGLGLKAGIYSTPWVSSYANFPGGSADNADGTYTPRERQFGAVSFDMQDAAQYAAWGFDYLKLDWEPNDIPHTRSMRNALQATKRDIVLSLSNSAPFQDAQGLSEQANCWRTTGDIRDVWTIPGRDFNTYGVADIGFSMERWRPFAGPGHWNDPDMLVVGLLGWGPNLRSSRLTPDEQYTHISLWCMLSAPLLIGCDLTRLDPFTKSLLTNDEVLAVNQDALGQQATQITAGDHQVWAKHLENGDIAVGLFNLTGGKAVVTLNWSDLKLTGNYTVRDLWRQQDIGVFEGKYDVDVPSHGVVLVKLGNVGQAARTDGKP